jgi:fucose permease
MLLPLAALGPSRASEQDGAAPAATSRQGSRQIGRLARDRSILLVSALVTASLLLENAVEQWSTLFVELTYGSSATLASLAPGLYMTALFVGRMGAQALATRVPLGRLLRWGSLGTALCFGAIAYAGPLWLTLGAVTVMGLLMAPLVPGLFSWVGRGRPDHSRAEMLGAVTAVSYLGYLASPILVGALSATVGFRLAWAALGGIALLAFVAVAWHGRLE